MGYEADDSFKSFEVEFNSESSPMTHKADASSAMGSPEAGGQRDLDVGRLADEKSEHGAGVVKSDDFDENRRAVGHGESLESAGRAWDPSPRQNRSEILELVRCPHRLAELLVQGMELAGVDLVDCLAGCGHRLYSDRGPVECPCHWPAVKVEGFVRALRLYQNPRAN